MFGNRNLNANELAFIKDRISRAQRWMYSLFVIIAAIIVVCAFFVYTEVDTPNFAINLGFGLCILLLYNIYWFVKGYKSYQVNPSVQKGRGFYKRIYEGHGKHGSYHDTFDGVKVKIPWHWRSYLKKQKEAVLYEYIETAGAVAINEGAFRYLVSVNDTLFLDYEIEHGLKKAKPISFFNVISIIALVIVVFILSLGDALESGLKISQLSKTSNHPVVLNSGEDLKSINEANYIKIDQAWVYQYNGGFSLYGNNYMISEVERNRIYNHPSSNYNYRYFFSVKDIKRAKPNKTTFKEGLKSNALFQKFVGKKIVDSLYDKAIDYAFKKQMETYNQRLFNAKKYEAVLLELKPKTTILKLNEGCFRPQEAEMFSIKKSLETQVEVYGFYNPKDESLISIEDQEVKRAVIKKGFTLLCIYSIIALAGFLSIVKIIYNSRLKMELVKSQLYPDSGAPKLKRK
ncbi:hypothetical protein ACFFU1_02140 [Algibacter miyuki]|uniref:DUF3137 domain-containing protein n=1 Tax=Algibacter miyuki TaxID=1306933 RepID=A0ABV5GVM9_9FLAO|nr:hypothetical protein [Algibacter miyuki]MDN3665014.1 hypothetical protein [Algibacter miyuki]